LLAKYGGLQWRDPNNGYVKLIAGKDIIHWTKPTKKNGGGYGILAYDEHYQEDDHNNKQHVEPLLITNNLIECIAKFYQNNQTAENIKVIEQPEDDAVNDDDNDDVEAEVVDNEAKYY
jgi:hypothetical protein